MPKFSISQELKDFYIYAVSKAREDRPRYFEWIQNEINEVIRMINAYDKIYVLGYIGAKVIRATPTMYNQFLEELQQQGNPIENENELVDDDDQSELLLEYAMSIATAEPNTSNVIPTQQQLEDIYAQLAKIKQNISFWELSAEIPAGGKEHDHWLRTAIMQNTIHVRGDGFHVHVKEVYLEMFAPHDGFLEQYYGFNSSDIYNTIIKLDQLVYSKVGNPFVQCNLMQE